MDFSFLLILLLILGLYVSLIVLAIKRFVETSGSRSTAESIAWMAGIVAFPFLGSMVFLLIGKTGK